MSTARNDPTAATPRGATLAEDSRAIASPTGSEYAASPAALSEVRGVLSPPATLHDELVGSPSPRSDAVAPNAICKAHAKSLQDAIADLRRRSKEEEGKWLRGDGHHKTLNHYPLTWEMEKCDRLILWCECHSCRKGGKGAPGAVFNGWMVRHQDDTEDPRKFVPVAVRVFLAGDLAGFYTEVNSFRAKVNALRKLRELPHPPSVPLAGYGQYVRDPGKERYFVATVERNGDLASLLGISEEEPGHDGPFLGNGQRLELARGLARCLRSCHEAGVFHDPTPQKVRVISSGGSGGLETFEPLIELCDFETGPRPPLWKYPGTAPTKDQADRYCLGLTIYEILCGVRDGTKLDPEQQAATRKQRWQRRFEPQLIIDAVEKLKKHRPTPESVDESVWGGLFDLWVRHDEVRDTMFKMPPPGCNPLLWDFTVRMLGVCPNDEDNFTSIDEALVHPVLVPPLVMSKFICGMVQVHQKRRNQDNQNKQNQKNGKAKQARPRKKPPPGRSPLLDDALMPPSVLVPIVVSKFLCGMYRKWCHRREHAKTPHQKNENAMQVVTQENSNVGEAPSTTTKEGNKENVNQTSPQPRGESAVATPHEHCDAPQATAPKHRDAPTEQRRGDLPQPNDGSQAAGVGDGLPKLAYLASRITQSLCCERQTYDAAMCIRVGYKENQKRGSTPEYPSLMTALQWNRNAMVHGNGGTHVEVETLLLNTWNEQLGVSTMFVDFYRVYRAYSREGFVLGFKQGSLCLDKCTPPPNGLAVSPAP